MSGDRKIEDSLRARCKYLRETIPSASGSVHSTSSKFTEFRILLNYHNYVSMVKEVLLLWQLYVTLNSEAYRLQNEFRKICTEMKLWEKIDGMGTSQVCKKFPILVLTLIIKVKNLFIPSLFPPSQVMIGFLRPPAWGVEKINDVSS